MATMGQSISAAPGRPGGLSRRPRPADDQGLGDLDLVVVDDPVTVDIDAHGLDDLDHVGDPVAVHIDRGGRPHHDRIGHTVPIDVDRRDRA